MKSVAFIFGTRPEAIKLAPIIRKLKDNPQDFIVHVVVTAQHREMLDQALTVFGIVPDFDLNIMSHGQDLFGVTVSALSGIKDTLDNIKPDWVVVQGDTTTTFAGAIGAFYKKIPVAHVEAGLRTGNIYNPFPEEINRQIAGRIAKLHLAPTKGAKRNLLAEGVNEETIYVTGNTGIDALMWVNRNCENELDGILPPVLYQDTSKRLLLVTTHRRESFGEPMRDIMMALRKVAEDYRDIYLLFPVHMNPNVRRLASEYLADVDNIILREPLSYVPFVQAMKRSYLVLTDSGGIQEEAPSLGKPVLVLREMTERPEGIDAGNAMLVGTDREKIHTALCELLDDENKYRAMSCASNPYGDGKASDRIATLLADR